MSPLSTTSHVSPVLKQNKSSPSRISGTQNGSADLKESHAMPATSINESSLNVSNEEEFFTEPLVAESTSKSNNRSPSKFGTKRRSFSGPLKSSYGSSMLGSPAVPSYMAATQSAKAKARSQSNPKLRPEADERTSPVSKRRTSLPAESKQNSVPWRTFRSSSTKGFSSLRASREGGG